MKICRTPTRGSCGYCFTAASRNCWNWGWHCFPLSLYVVSEVLKLNTAYMCLLGYLYTGLVLKYITLRKRASNHNRNKKSLHHVPLIQLNYFLILFVFWVININSFSFCGGPSFPLHHSNSFLHQSAIKEKQRMKLCPRVKIHVHLNIGFVFLWLFNIHLSRWVSGW